MCVCVCVLFVCVCVFVVVMCTDGIETREAMQIQSIELLEQQVCVYVSVFLSLSLTFCMCICCGEVQTWHRDKGGYADTIN